SPMGQPPTRVRYNAKARGSTAGGSLKRGKSKKPNVLASDALGKNPIEDSNMEIVMAQAPAADEQLMARKEQLKAQLIAASESKMSSKKKKKLDNYINKKLKKEERQVLFEKLAKTQAQVPSTSLHSSASLGSGRLKSNSRILEEEEDKAIRRALTSTGSRKRRRVSKTIGINVSDEDDSDDSEYPDPTPHEEEASDILLSASPVPAPIPPQPVEPPPEPVANTPQSLVLPPTPVVVGSGLKRNADGTVIAPRVVPKRVKPSREALRKRDKPVEILYAEPESSGESEEGEAEENDDSSEGEADNSDDSFDSSASSADGSEGGSDEEDNSTIDPSRPRKRLGFKDWAQRQIGLAKAPEADPDVPEHPAENLLERPAKPQPRPADGMLRGPLGSNDAGVPQTAFASAVLAQRETVVDGRDSSSTKRFVHVERAPEIQDVRLMLPAIAEEQAIMEAVRLNPVVIICGETGSGKTTQVPQFLYEAGFGSPGSDNPGMIGITQPRRVAAMSMAARVATELALPPSKVSYQIRYDATVSPSTVIKFMTDGVLLRELANDFILKKYSVIIVDEAHERSMNTDILIGVLSRVMKLRAEMWEKEPNGAVKPLRLIIMSATLRVTDFSENKTLFPSPPPIININARQHPVTNHFNRRTSRNYVTDAVRKATKIHARLPPGGILIFLTGQDEIVTACKKLEAKFGKKALEEKRRSGNKSSLSFATFADENHGEEPIATQDANGEVAEDVVTPDDAAEVVLDEDDQPIDEDALDSADDDEGDGLDIDTDVSDVPMHIVPLYSLLSSENQLKAFKPPPEGSRLVVVATNVAETSLTIPGVRYVIDCGRAKQREYDINSGVQNFKITWISKASAAQRAGRAGRTGPGHCYRLYSSAVFENHFDAFAEPEIMCVPIEGVVLQMKSMHIDAVANFPFPTPPDRLSLKKAEALLTNLGALGFTSQGKTITPRLTIGGHITDLGKAMAAFPLSPRFSRMLVSARKNDALPYIVAIVAALSVGNPFLHENFIHGEDASSDGAIPSKEGATEDDADAPAELAYITNPELRAKEIRKIERQKFFKSQQLHMQLGGGASDVFRILSVVGAYEFGGRSLQFCAEHFVRPKAMEEIHKLRAQISNIVQATFPETKAPFIAQLPPPNSKQVTFLSSHCPILC
ncbi:P-loop containing nucleoside triphosphate hydrolase protein, partial [Clavulina sp. PMI_390]